MKQRSLLHILVTFFIGQAAGICTYAAAGLPFSKAMRINAGCAATGLIFTFLAFLFWYSRVVSLAKKILTAYGFRTWKDILR